MKRLMKHLMIFLLLMAMSMLFIQPQMGATNNNDPSVAKLRCVSGTVIVSQNGERFRLVQGHELTMHENDSLRTMPNSRAILGLYDPRSVSYNRNANDNFLGVVRLNPNTEFQLTKLEINNTLLRLNSGSARSTVSQTAGYRIQTPIATAGVLGTSFEIHYYPGESNENHNANTVENMKVDVFNGEVRLTLEDEVDAGEGPREVIIREGQYANAIPGSGIYLSALPFAEMMAVGAGQPFIEYGFNE